MSTLVRLKVIAGKHHQGEHTIRKGEVLLHREDLSKKFANKFLVMHHDDGSEVKYHPDWDSKDSPSAKREQLLMAQATGKPIPTAAQAARAETNKVAVPDTGIVIHPIVREGKLATADFAKAGKAGYTVYELTGKYFVFRDGELDRPLNPNERGKSLAKMEQFINDLVEDEDAE